MVRKRVAGLKAAKLMVDEAPTVDAEAVIHSYWSLQVWEDEDAGKLRRAGYKCDNCGQHSAVKYLRCMTCGAHMDGQRKDGGEGDG
jgi:DNA-directed RNA polymerase subunit RPC12/RpoP